MMNEAFRIARIAFCSIILACGGILAVLTYNWHRSDDSWVSPLLYVSFFTVLFLRIFSAKWFPLSLIILSDCFIMYHAGIAISLKHLWNPYFLSDFTTTHSMYLLGFLLLATDWIFRAKAIKLKRV